MPAEWLTVAQAAQRLAAPEWGVHKWCSEGLLERRPPGNYQGRPGLCWCGCGNPAPIAGGSGGRGTDASRGHTRGQPIRYIRGHNYRVYVSAASVARLKTVVDARRAVKAAWHKVAVLAATGGPGDGQALLEATAELAERKAELLVTRLEGMLDG